MEPTERNRRAWDEIHRSRAEATAGQLGIPEVIRAHLPDISGKHVLHLQCGTGESTAELATLGALVTALDISAEALEVARTRAPDVAYLHADVQSLPVELRRTRFDLVFGSGVLPLLHDLEAWAVGVVSALRPGGELLLYDRHPVATYVDDALRWHGDYFDAPAQLGVLVTAIIDAGLQLRRFEELPSTALYPWVHENPHVPREFLLLAEKPTA